MRKVKLMMMMMLMVSLMIPTLYSCTKDDSPTASNCNTTQCTPTAASTGNRCLNKTTNCNGRCHQHQ